MRPATGVLVRFSRKLAIFGSSERGDRKIIVCSEDQKLSSVKKKKKILLEKRSLGGNYLKKAIFKKQDNFVIVLQ